MKWRQVKTMSRAALLDTSKLKDCRVVAIIGTTCTGKTYVGKNVLDELNKHSPYAFDFIETSAIVKKLSKNPSKDGLDLLENDKLMITIVNEVSRFKNVVLTGLREKKIHQLLKEHCKWVYTIRVTAPEETIAKRVYQRKDVDIEKLNRDKKYDFDGIAVDFVLPNVKETSWVEVFWCDDFRKGVGLLV